MNEFYAIVFMDVFKNIGLGLSEISIIDIKKREGKILLNI